MDAYNRKTTNPLTGEPDAGDPPVRFGGRGKVNPLSLPLSPALVDGVALVAVRKDLHLAAPSSHVRHGQTSGSRRVPAPPRFAGRRNGRSAAIFHRSLSWPLPGAQQRQAETRLNSQFPSNFQRNWLAPSLRDTVPRSGKATVQERPAGPAKI